MGDEPEAPSPRYLAGGLSEKGRRESNEDAAILAVFPPTSALRAFAILSDGMGGHNAGEVASSMAVEILREKVKALTARTDARPLSAETVEAEIRDWIAEVNREIYRRGKATAEQKGMGATLALALVLADDRLVAANVGDSRIYLVSGLNVRQLSVDHTALAEQRRALGSDSVAPEDDAHNPFAHALTRSLGQERNVEPCVRSDLTLGPGDVVLLTTDGVTDVLEAERFLTALETSGSLQETADEIHRLAFEAGSKDNISVALLSRGTPARLGLGRTSASAPAEPAVPRAAGAMLVAGAASDPGVAFEPRPQTKRTAALGAGALALLAVFAAALFMLRRPAVPPAPGAVAPAPAAPAPPPPQSAAPVPTETPTPLPAPPASPRPEAELAGSSGAPTHPPRRPTPRPAAAASEPPFRTPAVLSGLKPLEFPPTPTETPTATQTPTPLPTDTPTPMSVPTAPTGNVPAASDPRPASSRDADP